MKCKRFIGLLIPMLFCIAFVGKSQETKMLPMLAIGNKWNTIHKCMANRNGWTGELTYTRHYQIDREVELNGKKYFEILFEGNPVFYMREDFQTGKVYAYYDYKNGDNMGEQVVFDYNLKAGDTFFWYNGCDHRSPTYLKVLYVKEIELQGTKRRAYKVKYYRNEEAGKDITLDDLSEYEKENPLTGAYWLEGIGSQQGIRDIYPLQMTGGEPEYIACFTDKEGKTFYFGNRGNECEFEEFKPYRKIASVDAPLWDKVTIHKEGASLHITGKDTQPHSISVYDMSGQLLAREERFVDSTVLRLPALGEKSTVLIRLDDESTLYTL